MQLIMLKSGSSSTLRVYVEIESSYRNPSIIRHTIIDKWEIICN